MPVDGKPKGEPILVGSFTFDTYLGQALGILQLGKLQTWPTSYASLRYRHVGNLKMVDPFLVAIIAIYVNQKGANHLGVPYFEKHPFGSLGMDSASSTPRRRARQLMRTATRLELWMVHQLYGENHACSIRWLKGFAAAKNSQKAMQIVALFVWA